MIIAPRDALSNAIRYWERGRIVYNIVLVAVVLGCFLAGWPASLTRLTWDLAQGIFLLAVLANVAYCAAYVPDLIAQLSDFRPGWLRYRWMLFVVGAVFAGVITRFLALGMFGGAA